ncbi:MAG: mechanosensitive ion channel family protein [Gammaproteobacteria bacterium]|nr:mechanosensitive ion channel family protein [Gammaproteobacteria bacterium]
MDTGGFWSVLGFNEQQSWVPEVFVVLFLVLLFGFILRLGLNRLHRRLQRTPNPWDDALVDAARLPLTLLLWTLGISFAVGIARDQTDVLLFTAVEPIRDVVVIVLLAWFLVRLINRVEQNVVDYQLREDSRYDRTTADMVAKVLRVSTFITAAMVILQTLGFSITGVLAFGGIGGIAVGFAAKDLLSNFFGGLMIYLDRPFKVGDWIRSSDREIEGVVESIGWRLTTIRTFDKRPLYIPNCTFTILVVQNPSRMTNRRIYETIGIRYDDVARLPRILEEVKGMLESHVEIDHDQTLMVNFNQFGPSSLDFFIYTLTKTTNWAHFHKVKEEILLKISDIIRSHGAEIAFPTTTVHLEESPPPEPRN